jgi:hypothetical protein
VDCADQFGRSRCGARTVEIRIAQTLESTRELRVVRPRVQGSLRQPQGYTARDIRSEGRER